MPPRIGRPWKDRHAILRSTHDCDFHPTRIYRMDWIAPLLTLTAMEIVLGIDNVIFIAILVQRLPVDQQAKARRLGLGLALVARLGLLFAINWIMTLTYPVFRLTELGIPESWLYSANESPEHVLETRDVVS